jgi:two-component system sensor histidine kinase GlrK
LPDVVRRVVREQKLAAFARMITIEAKLAPAVVVGDTEKLRTIVDNLVSNAIKYSPRSGVIGLDLATADDCAVLEVSDGGPGVPASERERIFDLFYSGKPPVDGKVKGSGLGLAIAREYAIAHGGQVEFLDRADGKRGARLRMTLPLATPASRTRSAAPAAPITTTAPR